MPEYHQVWRYAGPREVREGRGSVKSDSRKQGTSHSGPMTRAEILSEHLQDAASDWGQLLSTGPGGLKRKGAMPQTRWTLGRAVWPGDFPRAGQVMPATRN